ncbi:gliding motility-associated C-terminal domain-containing protein [Sphingobacterium sp. LRF_L2]|uniref:rhamnogalacturonan lyase family protein n=1 Tax=Sphingobacterium sp. LRF_L2 TaxID=3369421 RepID=UPI003F5EE5CE
MKRFLWSGIILCIAVASFAFVALNKNRIVLIGDSTVQSGQETRENGLWGWGSALKELYETTDLEIDNEAIAGTSSRTFYRDHFATVLGGLNSGDILLLQFGHNDVGSVTGDGKSSLKGIGTDTRTVTNTAGGTEIVRSYGWYLQQMVQQAKAKGVKPVVVSPVPKNNWNEEFIARDVEEYALWAKQIATQEAVTFLDLHNLVADLYDQLGQTIVDGYFPSDALHTNKIGATETAKIVYQALFDLEIIADPLLNTWELIGAEGQVSDLVSTYPNITTRKEGQNIVPYASFTNSDGLIVKKMTSTGVWEQVGGVVSAYNATTGNFVPQARVWVDAASKLYVTYVDGNNSSKLAMKYWDETSNSWQPLGKNEANLYVSPQNVAYAAVSQLRDNRNHAVAFDAANVPYVVYADNPSASGGTGFPYVKRFVNGAWELVGGVAASSSRTIGFSLAFDSNGSLYLSYLPLATATATAAAIEVKKYTESAGWETFGTPVSGNARFPTMVISNDIMLLSFMNTGSNSRAFLVHGAIASPVWTSFQVAAHNTATDESLWVDAVGNVGLSYIQNYTTARVFYLPKEKVTTALTATDMTQLHASATADGLDAGASRMSIYLSQDGKTYVSYLKSNSAAVVTPVIQRYHMTVDMTEPEEEEEEPGPDEVVTTPKQIEALDRGIVAVRGGSDYVLVSWRLLANESMDLGFNVYRDGIKLNAEPITNSTNYKDVTTENGKYVVVPVVGEEEGESSYAAEVWTQGFLSIPLQMPPTGVSKNGTAYTHTANDLSVGDLDGDGQYEVIVKWEPTLSGDNSAGQRGKVYFDAYKLDGTKLWRIDMGINIRAGAHYTQFLVYDFDGDGKAEIAMRTSDGTVDGAGVVIGDANADYREDSGFILTGPEYLTVFEGATGRAMASVDYVPERGRVSDWGDGYGNRVDRFVAAVAYLDGQRPSMVFGRGYYTRMVRAAWDWRDGKLTQRWVFDTNTKGNESYEHAGNHQMSVADVDNDGKDEIINGASIINDNGKKYSNTERGHGDALHVAKMDPNRENLMIWQPHESVSTYGDAAILLRDAKTNESIVKVAASRDIGRAMAADIDPRYKGYEMWSAAGGLYNATGLQVSTSHPGSMNFGIWWDGDLLRELLDDVVIYKWDYATNTQKRAVDFSPYNVVSNNSTKANPGLSADLLGDWREEVIFRTADSKQLLLFSTGIPTDHKLYTLMHDPMYRVAIAWQNSGYNQPPHPSFYLGADMATQEAPNVELVELEKKAQEITFPALSESTYDVQQLRPQATATSGLMVQYSSDNAAVVKVEGQQLKFVGVGTANITAKQSGNVVWAEAEPVRTTLVVDKGIQTINFETLPTLTVGDKAFAPIASSNAELPITFQSEDQALASIVNNEILVQQEGRAAIVAKQAGNELWEAAADVRQELEILALPSMDVVKVITPNGDGDNDILIIKEIERYPENTFRVFNRQGQLLFQIENYNNSDRVFDGRDAARRLLNDGTYFFKLEWNQDGKNQNQSGWFYLKK